MQKFRIADCDRLYLYVHLLINVDVTHGQLHQSQLSFTVGCLGS